MKKISIVLVAIILMAFNSESKSNQNNNNSTEIKKEIIELQELIVQKQKKAQVLQSNAVKLNNVSILEETNLLRLQCYKYEAAIACLENWLK